MNVLEEIRLNLTDNIDSSNLIIYDKGIVKTYKGYQNVMNNLPKIRLTEFNHSVTFIYPYNNGFIIQTYENNFKDTKEIINEVEKFYSDKLINKPFFAGLEFVQQGFYNVKLSKI